MKILLLTLALFCGSLAASTVTAISCAAGVATVTAANTFTANQGFEMTGTGVAAYNVNSSVVSANSTSFTFKVACNGTASAGTVVAAWQILVPAITFGNGIFQASTLFWLTTPNPTACPTCTSAWPPITAAQLAAIQAGTTVESPQGFSFNATTTGAAMGTTLAAAYAALQTGFSSGLTAFALWCTNGAAWSGTCN